MFGITDFCKKQVLPEGVLRNNTKSGLKNRTITEKCKGNFKVFYDFIFRHCDATCCRSNPEKA
jgi:hypothetical protein